MPLGFYVENTATGETSQAGGGGEEEAGGHKEQRDKKEKATGSRILGKCTHLDIYFQKKGLINGAPLLQIYL